MTVSQEPAPNPDTSPSKSTARGTQLWGTLAAALRPQLGIFDYGALVMLIVLFVALSIASPAFLTKSNLLNILQANASIGLSACAVTVVIIAGGIDLSVGAIYALAGVLSAKVAISTGVGAGIAAGVVAGGLLGLLNGLIITVGRVNALVATIAGSIVIAGGAQVFAGQNLLTPQSGAFTDLGNGSLVGVKYSIWLFGLAVIVFGLLLSKARFGRRATAIGSNAEAARLSGVSVNHVRCATYVLSGLMAALAGVVDVSQAGQAQSNIGGTPFVLSVIAAIAVGGISLRGGRGAIWRTLVGVLFLGLVTNGLALLNVQPLYYQLFTGLLILAAVAGDTIARREIG